MPDAKPPLLVFNGEVVGWEKATVHVWSETAIRATNAFEGLRAYWVEGSWVIPAWTDHMRRLEESLLLQRIPVPDLECDLQGPMHELLHALPYREDLYLRPTVFVEEGRYGLGETKIGSYLVAFPQPRVQAPPSLRCLVSSWRRASDLVAPPRAKVGAAYNALRLPRIEAATLGFDEALLLNEHNQVAELTGACVLAVRGERVVSPPASAGTLESITRQACIELLAEAKIDFEERPMDRSELYVCEELFACGTLLEIAAICTLDDVQIGDGDPGEVTSRLFDAYRRRAMDPATPGSLLVAGP